jgi:hypothetical protein
MRYFIGNITNRIHLVKNVTMICGHNYHNGFIAPNFQSYIMNEPPPNWHSYSICEDCFESFEGQMILAAMNAKTVSKG